MHFRLDAWCVNRLQALMATGEVAFDDWLFSFDSVCEALGLDAASLRVALIEMAERKSDKSYKVKLRKPQEPIRKERSRKDRPGCRLTRPALTGIMARAMLPALAQFQEAGSCQST